MEEQHNHLNHQGSAVRQRPHIHNQKIPKSRMIIVYTVLVCLSCLYLETQHFMWLLGDERSYYMGILTYFDVVMCLWSYFQTIRIKNVPPKLRNLQPQEIQSEKFADNFYSPTHKYCTICQNYKFPRVNHCNTCNKCQYKMDHHCIWTQTCIGFSNQKSFYLFCLYMALGVCQFWYFSYRVLDQKTQPLMKLVQPGVIILWVFTAFSAFFVGIMIIALTITHSIMLFTNFRTLDGIKMRKMCPLPFCQHPSKPENLFDRGELQNAKGFFGHSWWLWWIPLARQVENQIYPEGLSPHPSPYRLMGETNLYDLEEKYKKEMKRLPELNFLPHFVGQKMRLNGEVFLIGESY